MVTHSLTAPDRTGYFAGPYLQLSRAVLRKTTRGNDNGIDMSGLGYDARIFKELPRLSQQRTNTPTLSAIALIIYALLPST